MEDAFIVQGLAKRRAALAGDIGRAQIRLNQMLTDLKSLDAAIRVLDADYPIDKIKPAGLRATGDWAMRGELTRLMFTILRQSHEPMSARDIAFQVMAHKQMDVSRPKVALLMRRRVGEALRKQRHRGQVRSCGKEPGQPLLWETITQPIVASTPSTAD
jgi:hypothetical protein